MAARGTFYFAYQDNFSDLSQRDVITAFIYGIRFDASTIITFIGLPLLLTLIPHRFAQHTGWQKTWLWFIYAMFVVLAIALVADFIYFGFVNRHIGTEITLFSGDPQLMMDIIISDYGQLTLIFWLLVCAFAFLWHRWFSQYIHKPTRPIFRWITILLLFLAFIIIGRGGLQYKPVSVADAFAIGSTSAGYLSMNGAFAVQHAATSGQPKKIIFMPQEQAEAVVQDSLSSPNEQFLSPDYPLLRTTINRRNNKPNIVIFMLESWDAIHMDVMRRDRELSSLGVTPNFDALSRQGQLYNTFYATGQRSMDGLAAILASVPTLPGMPYIGKGLEQSRLSYLGALAKQAGYQTLFLQSSNRGSFHIDAIAAQAGFDQYLGAEDIPAIHKNVSESHDWGVWDFETLNQAHHLFEQSETPFVGLIFTSTTHNPWRVPHPRWEKFPLTNERNRYLNSLYYADWAIGEFFKLAKQTDYYRNTIFILTGDHISPFDAEPKHVPSRYHIPLLIIGPDLAPAKIDRIGSQLDILPSIIDLAGWSMPYTGLGRSLFQETPPSGIFTVNGNIIDWIEANAWLSHNLTNRIESYPPQTNPQLDAMEKKLLATYQTTLHLFLENRLFPAKYNFR